MGKYHVYIMASVSRTLYVGMTNNLERRVWEHKTKASGGFTARYNVNRLVYSQEFYTPMQAITAEKSVKGWLRSRKIALIESVNPGWEDLAAEWFTAEDLQAKKN